MSNRKPNYYKEYYAKNRERIRSQDRKRCKDNPEKTLWRSARDRAARRGQEFSISIEDIIIPAICPILCIPLFQSTTRTACKNSPVLDRIDNTKGYVKGNIAVISHRANTLKSDLSFGDINRLLRYVSSST